MLIMRKRCPYPVSLFSLLGLLAFWSIAWAQVASSSAHAAAKNMLVDNFENASMKNLLGGYIGADTAAPGTCRFCFTWNPANTFGNAAHSLQIDYDVRSPGSYTYLWLHLGPEGSDEKVRSMDLRGFSYLSFWVKTNKRGENFKVELHCDSNHNGRFDPNEDTASSVYVDRYLGSSGLTERWRKVVIPLADFSSIKDFSSAIEIVIVFENLRGNRQGTIYLDEILLGTGSLSISSTDSAAFQAPKTLPPPTATAGIHSLPTLTAGLAQPLAARCNKGPGLEGVGFEISWDEGKNWALVGMDYDISKGSASISWKVPPLPPSQKVLLRAFSQGIRQERAPDMEPLPVAIKSLPDGALIRELTRRSFLYFLDNQNPDTGLFLDSEGGDASTAVAGFGLAAMAIGAREGWVDAKSARKRALKTLNSYLLLQKGKYWAKPVSVPAPQIPASKDGFFYHFMKPRSGARAGTSEISVVDTALLLFGALTAGEYFGGEVKALAERMYDGVQWNKFFDPQSKTLLMAWSPEKGYFPNHWDYYTDETILLHILAAGSKTSPIPGNSFYSFKREKGHFGDGQDFVYSWSGALFTHQYAAAWLDLKGWQDRDGCDWWENSRRATAASRDYCWYNRERPGAYGPHRWGISSFQRPEGYVMHYGTLPNGSGQAQEDGTLSPIACAASITFLPFAAIHDLKQLLANYPFLWGPYGLRNAYNIERSWFSSVDFGLDTGLLLLSLENFKNGLAWKTLAKSPIVQRGLSACGLSAVEGSDGARGAQSPNKFDAAPPVEPALPPIPEASPEFLFRAQGVVQEMENLCNRDNADALARFLQNSEASYDKALGLLEMVKGSLGKNRAHCYWLKALIASRRASPVIAGAHLRMMLRQARDVSTNPLDRLAFLRGYQNYIVVADLRDFQEEVYAAFRQEAQQAALAAALEDFARYCEEKGRYAMAVRAWEDSLDILRKEESAQGLVNRIGEIAKGFSEAGRVEDAMVFDRIFLDEIRSKVSLAKAHPDWGSRILELGQKYQAAGKAIFSRECYSALLALPTQVDRGEVLYQLGKLEEASKNHAKAIAFFKAILQGQPQGVLTEYAEFGIAVNKLLLEANAKTLQCMEDFVRKYPNSALREHAAFNLGIAYFERKNFEEAKKHLQSVSSQDEDLSRKAASLLVKMK